MKILATAMVLALAASGAIANPNLDAAAVVLDRTGTAVDPAQPTRRERAAATVQLDNYVPNLGATSTLPAEPPGGVTHDSYPVGDQPTVDEGYPAKQECDTCH